MKQEEKEEKEQEEDITLPASIKLHCRSGNSACTLSL